MISFILIKPIEKIVQYATYHENSFIAWERFAIMQKRREVANRAINRGELVSHDVVAVEYYDAQYEYYFRINLFFVVIKISFKGKEITK